MTPPTPQITDDIISITQSASARLYNQFRYYGVDRNDMEQEFYDWFMSHPGRVKSIMGKEWDGEPITDKHVNGRLWRQAAKIMATVARNHKAMMSGYQPEDEQFYSRKALELMLPALWDPGYRDNGPERPQDTNQAHGFGRVARDPREHNMWQTMVHDVEQAWDRAKFQDNEAAALELYYGDRVTQNALGERLGISQEAARKLLNRALARLGDQINGGPIPEVAGRLAEPEPQRVDMEE